MSESFTHHIPGWEQSPWAVRGIKSDIGLVWETGQPD
jgi:hypothetical protein